ncbi:hypothetical protein BGX29_005308, partial [Mortierella sp. GBA35]
AQRAQQELVKQLTLATGAWNINPDSNTGQDHYYPAEHNGITSNNNSNSSTDRSISSTTAVSHVRDNERGERVVMLETVRPQEGVLPTTSRRPSSRDHISALPPLPSTDTPTTRTPQQQQQQQQQQSQERISDHGSSSSRSSTSGSSSSPGNRGDVAKASMLPYVEDDAEDDDEYSGEEEDEEEDEDEDDYSYSVDEEEEEEEEEEDSEDEDSSS